MKRRIIIPVLGIFLLTLHACKQEKKSRQKEDKILRIEFKNLQKIGEVDERYQSYNIEMASVVGGRFWRPYKNMDTLPGASDYSGSGFSSDKIYQRLEPIDLSNKKLRNLARGLAPAYVRVSGTWANAAFFQNDDNPKMKIPPKGFLNVLTRKEWKGVIDFIESTDSKLVTSFAISNGVRDKNGRWTPKEVEKLMAYTQEIGGKIYAAEPFNEPNIPHVGGEMPESYSASDYAKDVQLFNNWKKKNEIPFLSQGPGSVGEGVPKVKFKDIFENHAFTSEDLMSAEPHPQFDIFSFHYYGALSRRLGDTSPWDITFDQSLTNEWFSRIDSAVIYNIKLRDKYLPHAKIWNTETAQAAGGGEPWAAEYIDTFRYLYELGRQAQLGVWVNMHNTLESSEYSFVDRDTFEPKPNYWAALLWAKLMGTTVYEPELQPQDGVYVFAHNLHGNNSGKTILILNTNKKSLTLDLPSSAIQYTLTSEALDSQKTMLNGGELHLVDDDIPEIKGNNIEKGDLEIPGLSITFLTFK